MISQVLLEELNKAQTQNLLSYEVAYLGDQLYITFLSKTITLDRVIQLQNYIKQVYNYHTERRNWDIGLIVYNHP